jgi:hypothetical protein
MKPKKRTEPFCKVEGCGSLWYGGRGYCAKHYIRLRKHGDPLVERKPGWLPGDPKNPSHNPERRAQISAWRKASVTTPETRERIRATMKARLQEPELKEKWRMAATGRKLDDETKKKISDAHAKRPKKLSTLIHNLDATFSKYIRYSYADGRGNLSCFTCDRVASIHEMDCGHFVSRQHKSTRWLEKNCHPQCRYCNRYNEGRKDVYAVRLVQKYGPNILLELQEEKHKIRKWTPVELQEMIGKYKQKLSELS